jgi:O-methyltransferase domain
VAASNPFDTLLQMAGGYCVPRCLHAVANLGVADALDDTPQTAVTLAAATGADGAALDRVLRLLSAYGVFEHQNGLIAHTPASRLLRADHPQSMRPLARMFGLPALWAVVGELEQSIRTGAPSADRVLEGGFWGYLAAHPEQSRVFDDAMTAKAYGQVAGVVAAYDFSGFGVIGDIGGGRGHLLQAVLASAPKASGILFDQPHVIEQASAVRSDRLRLQAGDFFKDDLPSCDAYLIMEVIHDWDDAASRKILTAVRRATPKHGKVLLIEAILPDDPGPSWPKTLDIVMLTMGGRQRTQREYADLFRGCGFAMTREIDTRAGVSIIEGVPG